MIKITRGNRDMKKNYIIFLLVLSITVIISGCQQHSLTDEEYEVFKGEFDSKSMKLSGKIAERTKQSITNEKVEKDEEFDNMIKELEGLLNSVKNKKTKEGKEFFKEYSDMVNIFKVVDKELIEERLSEKTGEDYYNVVTEYSKRRSGEEMGLEGESLKEYMEKDIFQSQIEDYKKDENLQLDWEEVQYNIPNNLDKEFIVAGDAKLSTYYNYGFKNDSFYFSVEVTPKGGNFSDSWHLYFNRESFDELFQKLRNGQTFIVATCDIPKPLYKKGQGNMARVNKAQWN